MTACIRHARLIHGFTSLNKPEYGTLGRSATPFRTAMTVTVMMFAVLFLHLLVMLSAVFARLAVTRRHEAAAMMAVMASAIAVSRYIIIAETVIGQHIMYSTF